MDEYPDVFWSLLARKENQLTAIYIQDLFKVQYSAKGSNDAKHEQAVIISVPVFGFEKTPIVEFYSEQGQLPSAATCTLALRLPWHLTDYAEFK